MPTARYVQQQGGNGLNRFIKYLKDLYTACNNKWLQEQRQQTAIMQQAQYEYNKQLMTNSSQVFLMFFRDLLGQITYFDTTSMKCDVVGIYGNAYRLCLQVPIRVSCQADMPSHKTLIQLIENLITAESVLQREQLCNKAYYLQTSCCTPAEVMRYNKAVEDHICSFMQYRVGIHSINSFKAVLVVECVLDMAAMQSFCLY